MTPGLIERLEGAGEGSRELDALIWAHLHPERIKIAEFWACYTDPRLTCVSFTLPPKRTEWVTKKTGEYPHAQPVTTSLDAALALASRVLDSKSALHLLADLLSYEAAQSDFDLIKTDDLPRLLCIAILKARATQEQG